MENIISKVEMMLECQILYQIRMENLNIFMVENSPTSTQFLIFNSHGFHQLDQ